MNALWRAIGVGGGIPNFPYTIGEEIDTKGCLPAGNNLKMFHGIKNQDDKGPVTIFQYQRMNELDALAVEGIKNAMKRAKGMMLPGCLRCHDSVEHGETLYFATEECMPLNYVLSSDSLRDSFYDDEEKFEHVAALGLETVGTTLCSMHKNSFVHGSVNSDNIYVLKNGAWRLFGYETLSHTSEDSGGVPPMYKRLLPSMREHRRAPELSSGGTTAAGQSHLVDSWGLGCLTYEVFHAVSQSTKASDMKSGRNIPRDLQRDFVGLIGTNPKLRHSIEKFLSNSSFIREDPFVQAVSNLEELNLKDAVEKDRYYRELALGCDQFPLLCCQRMLLPKLATVVQYGGSSAAVLEPLLRIGKRLSSEDFGASVAPAVVSLFSSPDHLIRCRLLSSAESYAKYLPQTLVCEKIWPQYVTGYQSKNADLRELTIRATVHFAPILTEALITSDVVKYLTLGQQDHEGPIRTNATVCLAFLAPTLPDAIRVKTLTNGLGRMLKDPFTPSRIAAVTSINSGLSHFPANVVATQLMPAVIPLTIDKFKDVRIAALKCIGNMTKVLEENSATLGDATTEAPAVNPNPAPSDATPSAAASTQGATMTPSVSSGTVDSQGEPKAEEGNSSWGWGWSGKKGAAPTNARTTSTTSSTHKDPTPALTKSGSTNSLDGWEKGNDDGWGSTSSGKDKEKTTTPTNSNSPAKPTPLPLQGISTSPAPPRRTTATSNSPTPAATTGGTMKLGGGGAGMKLGLKKKGGLGGTKVD